jgi:hypothetical protein
MKQVDKFYVQNFGCRATQADGAALETLLAAKGLEAAAERSHADLVVLNTCTVTQAAPRRIAATSSSAIFSRKSISYPRRTIEGMNSTEIPSPGVGLFDCSGFKSRRPCHPIPCSTLQFGWQHISQSST